MHKSEMPTNGTRNSSTRKLSNSLFSLCGECFSEWSLRAQRALHLLASTCCIKCFLRERALSA